MVIPSNQNGEWWFNKRPEEKLKQRSLSFIGIRGSSQHASRATQGVQGSVQAERGRTVGTCFYCGLGVQCFWVLVRHIGVFPRLWGAEDTDHKSYHVLTFASYCELLSSCALPRERQCQFKVLAGYFPKQNGGQGSNTKSRLAKLLTQRQIQVPCFLCALMGSNLSSCVSVCPCVTSSFSWVSFLSYIMFSFLSQLLAYIISCNFRPNIRTGITALHRHSFAASIIA